MSQIERLLPSTVAVLFLALTLAACGSPSTPTPSSNTPSSNGVVPSGSPAPSVTPNPIALGASINGMTCDPADSHPGGISAKISLSLDDGSGTPVLPTANIGVLKAKDCQYWVYSDASGGLVVDAPANAQATLSDFIAIWRLTDPNDQISVKFVIAMNGTDKTITVDGQSLDSSEAQNMPLSDGMEIVVK